MRIVIIFCLALSLHILHAQDSKGSSPESFSEKLRPTLLKIVGTKWTEKLLGAEKAAIDNAVILPPLPQLAKDAKSTSIYERKQDKIALTPDQEKKYYYSYILEIYNATRMMKPNDDEVAKLMNVLSQGGSREGVYHSLVLDSTYAGMENYDKPVKSVAADFLVYFYGRYVGKQIKKENLKGLNVYSLKRLMTDKSLDIIDGYGENRENVEKWYAVMSSDLASKYGHLWTSNLRKDTSSLRHKQWASKVPIQHIKSETIIKLHTIMNSMM